MLVVCTATGKQQKENLHSSFGALHFLNGTQFRTLLIVKVVSTQVILCCFPECFCEKTHMLMFKLTLITLNLVSQLAVISGRVMIDNHWI